MTQGPQAGRSSLVSDGAAVVRGWVVRLRSRPERLRRILVVALGLWSLGLAARLAFVLDDAFISYRYAANLVAGHGLVFNPGERVEGYTNFLWTLLMAVPMSFGVTPEGACLVIGPFLLVGSVLLVGMLARTLTDSAGAGLLAMLLLATNYTFVAFATGGLETPLVAVLTTASAVLVVSESPLGPRRACTFSIVAALALLTRLDAGVALAPLGLLALWRARRSPAASRTMAFLVAPGTALLGTWLAWKASYYGSLLPNTASAKIHEAAWMDGFGFLGLFVREYLFLPMLILTIIALARDRHPGRLAVGAAVLLTWGYVAAVGGDFMEFRFLVPTLPLLMALFAWSLVRMAGRIEVRVALIAALIVGSYEHAMTFKGKNGIESITGLRRHLTSPGDDWIAIGQALGKAFASDPSVRIAVTAAGAIPYYSRLPTIDMLGLSDPWIIAHGLDPQLQRGHSRVAPLSYLTRRRVNLVLAHPWVLAPHAPRRAEYDWRDLQKLHYIQSLGPGSLPEGVSVVEVPLATGGRLVALYLTPHPAVEQVIQTQGWHHVPVRRM